ncbi:hypothetical protein [Parasphingorhabdus sp.]|uniref:hypothetical protein n=1 Tax=Parasphingorhabdus sp. TaxID=2709688 RepID=UPI003A8F0825
MILVTIPNTRPDIKLSKLWDIGWTCWDPIGLLTDENLAKEKKGFDDEYDTYLMHAAGMIWRNTPRDDVVAYLVDIEQNYIGMPDRGPDAAKITVAKIQDYLKTL